MVSSLEKRYLSSADLSPLRTHFVASLKMSSKTITYSGYCHPLSPRQFHHNSSPKSPPCAYSFQKGSKVFYKFPLKIFVSRRTWSNLLLKRRREKCPWSSAKVVQKRRFNKTTQKCFQKCESISPSPLDICDSIRSEFDQVPTSCKPLFGSAAHVIKVCHTLSTDNSKYQP